MPEPHPRRFGWSAPVAIVAVGALAFIIVKTLDVWAYEQRRSFALLGIGAITLLLFVLWWFFYSGLGLRTRIIGLLLLAAPLPFFRWRGLSGDFVPIVEFRFAKPKPFVSHANSVARKIPATDYPQLFGPTRDGHLPGPPLDPDWNSNPPQLVWKQPIGDAWGGFVTAGDRAFTQEQNETEESVTCYDVATGKLLWKTSSPGRYEDGVAGIGPRATPTVSGDRLLALGALGTLHCLDLTTGKIHWTRNLCADVGAEMPEWGFASSPLVHEGKVIVSAGGQKSLVAYHLDNGEIAWTGGTRPVNYSSPFLYHIAGRPQIVMFNKEAITAHDPTNGSVLWEHNWGRGLPHVSRPIPVGDRRMFFSSGYGVGSALLELVEDSPGRLKADQVWKTPRFQSKFATPVERDGFVYGVSDGIFACLDLQDGSIKWKGGRYGHGQGLLVGDYYLQMTEQPGELVLLKPTPEAPNELARFPLFEDKTWNPIAITGDLLLARTDREAACIRLPTKAAN